LTRKGKHRTLF